jgi:hypothetical protein
MSEPSQATAAYAAQDSAAALVRVLDDYVAALEGGRRPDRAVLVAQHPELAQLDSCLAALEFIHRADQPAAEAPARLGDFRILREVGRGGMGVVYEAEQLSLKRRVALKVLRFGATPSPEALTRFQREAETVARLHHTNIVPVFAVGCEQGVHFYAMQFIEGQGLDKARACLNPSDVQVAGWGVQAAEALAHAHARGVIHRDIKPSNLLLDAEGVVWLTDFGLARRADEVTLTISGLLLGTPRYMSPEQAAATKQPVDERSDVYSLGATLYELTTGAPVYDGDTPQRLLAQILETEPVAPSRHRPEMPRDLETILLKCLAKEPERRYPTAQALADDLRRFVNGDPIKARRPSLRERAGRWLRRHRRSTLLATGAAAAALLAAAGLMHVSERVEHWLQGRLFLATDGPPLTAEVRTPEGQPACPSFTVPTEEPQALPAGDYLLRLRGRGYLDETYQVRVERGVERAFDVNLNDQRLWEPLTVPRCYELAALNGRTDLLVLSATGVTRRHGGTGAVLWTTDLEGKSERGMAGFRWDWDIRGTPSGRGDKDRRPRLLQPGPDLDGDGTPDLVWTSRRQAAVLALSGKDGHVLWCWQAPTKPPAENRFAAEHASTGIVLGQPAVIDIDGDGLPDLIVTCAQQARADGSVPRWVEALSGRTGKSLWRVDLDGHWFTPPPGTAVPDAGLWDNMIGISWSSGSGFRFGGDVLYIKDFSLSGHGLPVPFPALVVRLGQRNALAVPAGTRLVLLDPHDGRALAPAHDVGFWPLRKPQFADLAGDGKTDVLLLGPSPDVKTSPGSTYPPADDRLTLTAVVLGTGQTLWRETLRAYWGWHWFQEPFDWPWIADLDGDGRPEVIVPAGDFAGGTRWSGIDVRSGATGAVRWRKKLTRTGGASLDSLQQVNRLLVGPDLDGDGVRDLFTAVLDGQELATDQPFGTINLKLRFTNLFTKDYSKPILRVDALSGKDGRTLWSSAEPVRHGALTTMPRPIIGPLHWWHAGADGWPQLVVPYEHEPHDYYFFSAGTGQRLHLSTDLQDVQVADLDGDGVPDLVSFRPDRPQTFDQGGQLFAIRGQSPEAWRRLGGYWTRTTDLDGDGIPDLLSAKPPEQRDVEEKPRRRDGAARPKEPTDKPPTRAISGRDGHILWQTEITDGKPMANWQESRYKRILPAGVDLDGDGIPDLLVTGEENTIYSDIMSGKDHPFHPLVAVSGRTGRRIWTADIGTSLWYGPQLLTCRDLDGDGRPEVLFVSASDWDGPPTPNGMPSWKDLQYWLAVLDGATGRVKWRQPLSARNSSDSMETAQWRAFAFAVADLDGDGAPDLVIEAGLPWKDGEVRAFRGRDGEPLWTWKPAPRQLDHGGNRSCRPMLTVADLGGRRVVLGLRALENAGAPGTNGFHNGFHAELVALDGHTGKPLWSWQHPVDPDYNTIWNGGVKSRVVPQIVELGSGRRAVCLWTVNDQERGRLVLLDEQGRLLRTRAVDFRLSDRDRKGQRERPQVYHPPTYSPHFRVWRHDLDGDGRDELVVLTNDRLQVLTGDLTGVRWERPLPDAACELLDIYPATAGRSATLVLRVENHVLGLAGPDGRLLWTCAGSGTPLAVLPADAGGELPRVVFDLGDQATVCRRAQPAGDLGAAQGFVPYTPPQSDDARYVRPLPWNHITLRPPLFPASPWGMALMLAGLAAAVLVVPAWLGRRARRGRRWWLALAFAWLGLVWASVMVLYLLELNDDASFLMSQFGRWGFFGLVGLGTLLLAPLGLPLLAFGAAAWKTIRRHAWIRLTVLVLLALVLAAAVAGVWLYLAPPEDDQRFSHSGWPGIVPAGVYAVGVLLVAAWLCGAVSRLVRRIGRRLRPAAV